MARRTDATRAARSPMSRERVLTAAIALADAEGICRLTMLGLATHVWLEAMTLYHDLTT